MISNTRVFFFLFKICNLAEMVIFILFFGSNLKNYLFFFFTKHFQRYFTLFKIKMEVFVKTTGVIFVEKKVNIYFVLFSFVTLNQPLNYLKKSTSVPCFFFCFVFVLFLKEIKLTFRVILLYFLNISILNLNPDLSFKKSFNDIRFFKLCNMKLGKTLYFCEYLE